MATILKFDEIDKLNSSDEELLASESKRKILPISQYFEEMLFRDKERKQVRISMANEMLDMVLAFLMLIKLQKESGNLNEYFLLTKFQADYKKIASKYVSIDEYLDTHINFIASEILDATVNHISDSLLDFKQNSNKAQTSDYWVSEDRARDIAEEESNTVINHDEEMTAIRLGMKYKTWKTMRDRKVRDSHKSVDNMTIPINEPFLVGNSLMQYPKDESLGADAKEIIGCRCWIEYS